MTRAAETPSVLPTPPDPNDDLPPRRAKLSVSPEREAAWRAHLAEQEAKRLAQIAAAAKKPRRAGRDGNRLDLVEEQAADGNIHTHTVRNVASDPVEWLFNRGSLTQRQYEGANRLRQDAERGSIGGARAVDLAGAGGGGGNPGNLTDGQVDALQRYSRCMEQLGNIGGALVRAVVIECRDLKTVGESMGMDKNYRAPRLAEALDAVADFYRL